MLPMRDFFAEQSEKGTMKMFFDLMGTPPNLDEIRFVIGVVMVVVVVVVVVVQHFSL